MSTSLQSTLNELATSFADSILQAIRGASLEELLGSNAQARANGRAARAAAPVVRKAGRAGGRLQRRSAEDIARSLGDVVSLVKKHKEGLRAEQIRQLLGLQAKEMPRILKEGLEKRELKSKGRKRATTYFAS